jgi:hypothetical protein
MPNIGSTSTIPEIVASLEARQSQIHSRAINLRNLQVIDNRHFKVDDIDLFVDPQDEHPIKQLCSNIKMSYGFYASNPSALNQTIFDTKLKEIEGSTDNRDNDERKRDKGDRIIRYRTGLDGRNQLLAILPVAHQSVPYVDVIRPIAEALPKDAIVRLSNHDRVDQQHRFTMRASFPQLNFQAADNDPLEMGMYLDVSEDGVGKYTMSGLLYRLVCENGATVTFNNHPYFEYNYRGIRPVDLGAAVTSAIGRFGSDLAFVQQRCLESTKAIMSKDEVDSFVRQLEAHRNVSAGFLRKVRKELTAKTAPSLSRWDVVNEITLQAQQLPHNGRVQHEYLGGQLLGLNLTTE